MISQSQDGLLDREYDVCVVGSGPVGIATALRLEALGKSVLLLESGGENADRKIQSLADAQIDFPDQHESMAIATARRFGGTSNLWGGRCVPYDPVDFEKRPGLVDASWPIRYEDILPYYDDACKATDAGVAEFVLKDPALGHAPPEFSFDTVERWSSTPALQQLHAKALTKSSVIDVRLFSVVTKLNFAEDGRVHALDIVRPDGQGRLRLPVKTVVLAMGGVECTRLLLDAQRDAPSRFGGVDGPLGRYYMGHVTNVIADIEFARGAVGKAFDFLIDTRGGYVSRRFVASEDLQRRRRLMNICFWPVVPEIANADHRSGVLSAFYLALSFAPLGNFFVAEAIRRRHIPDPAPPRLPHLGNVLTDLPLTFRYVTGFMWKRYAARAKIPGFFITNRKNLYGLRFHSEQWPNPDSRITLTDMKDRLDVPKARIAFHYHERDVQSVLRAHEAFGEWLIASGLGSLRYRYAPEDRANRVVDRTPDGMHQIGTTRMATDRRSGVVDGDLRTFDCSNLYVASSSTFPTSGQCNPTLTAVAFALRLADRLSSEKRR